MIGGGALATTVLADRAVMWDVPDHWTLEQASTIPRVYSIVSVKIFSELHFVTLCYQYFDLQQARFFQYFQLFFIIREFSVHFSSLGPHGFFLFSCVFCHICLFFFVIFSLNSVFFISISVFLSEEVFLTFSVFQYCLSFVSLVISVFYIVCCFFSVIFIFPVLPFFLQ